VTSSGPESDVSLMVAPLLFFLFFCCSLGLAVFLQKQEWWGDSEVFVQKRVLTAMMKERIYMQKQEKGRG